LARDHCASGLSSERFNAWQETNVKTRFWNCIALAAASSLLGACASTTPPSAAPRADATTSQITVLYDAFGKPSAMQKDWGYAALVEYGGKRILFDTGNNGDLLAQNAKVKGIDLSKLDFVVMSHRHGDHMGGLAYLLSLNPNVKIYAPKEGFGVYGSDLPGAFYRKDASLAPEQRYYDGAPPEVMRFGAAWPGAKFQLVDKNVEIAPGIHLIALVSDKPGTLELRELSLAMETPDGMVIVVGCSHTGIDNIVKAAVAIQPKVQFVVGGFHLVAAKDPDIEAIITTLRDTYKVAYVAPGHCTGEPTFTALRKAFSERCLYAGLGSTIALSVPPRVGGDSGAPGPELSDDDLKTYQALFAASGERQRGMFANLQRTTTSGGAYIGQWRRSMVGCC
jgi:7,8-dihydropterin-6-yl-methyl-4-(beta-D-ribofuranosyl)aminobenzene 5'-phosphate synthase